MPDEQLLPCPFCGGEAMIREDNVGFLFVGCTVCLANIPSGYFHNGRSITPTVTAKHKEMADEWNRRV